MNFGKILVLTAVLLSTSAMISTNVHAAEEGTTQTKTSRVHSKNPRKKAARVSGLAPTSKKKTTHVVHSPNSKLGTDFDFQGLAVGGKYNSADGILTTVEGDKSLDNLLTPRPNFKDRLAEAAESQ